MIQHRLIHYPLSRIGFEFSTVCMVFLISCAQAPNPPKERGASLRNSNASSAPGLPRENNTPEAVWNAMRANLLSGRIDEAVQHFSADSAEEYRQSFKAMRKDEIAATMNKTIKKAVIEENTAQYYFEDLVGGVVVTFPVEFVKENGVWKILEF